MGIKSLFVASKSWQETNEVPPSSREDLGSKSGPEPRHLHIVTSPDML